MKRLALTFALLACAAAARAYAPLGYPGSTWGTLSSDFGKVEGGGSQGKVEQGVDWFKAPFGWTFDTFGGYSWMARTRNQLFYNENGPYAGALFSRGPFNVGADYHWERFPVLRQSARDFEAFASWYYRKDLGRLSFRDSSALGAPFSTWGRLQYDLDNIVGYGSMGWVQQGVEWFELPGGVKFETFGAFRWRERSRNQQFYDMFGPAAGIDLIRGPIDVDVEYTMRRYPYIPQWANGAQVVLTWYFGWDLKR